MKVWIVSSGYKYEQLYIDSVWSTVDAARARMLRMAETQRDGLPIFEGSDCVEFGNKVARVEVHNVDPAF